jgi:hypothetical protein
MNYERYQLQSSLPSDNMLWQIKGTHPIHVRSGSQEKVAKISVRKRGKKMRSN